MPTYRSERRQRQAQATRRDILGAARRLFAERGYAATSMTDIASTAGVAVQTIYASCGSKRDLVLALVDAIDEEADVEALGREVAAAQDPNEILVGAVRLTGRLQQRCGDIIGALLSAATSEPDVAAAAAEGLRRHRAGTARAARRLDDLGALRADITVDQAAALLSALTWQPVYAELKEHDFSHADWERWIATTLTETLLR